MQTTGFLHSDWAETHKQVSARVVMLDGCQLVGWSRTPGTVARSLGDAEFFAAAVASYELLGVASILREIGTKVEAHVRTDSNVCRAILSRIGSGRMEHLETRPFAMQQWIRRG